MSDGKPDGLMPPAMNRWSVKRILAGLVMLAVIAGLVFAVLNLQSSPSKPSSTKETPGVSQNAPAFTPNTQQQPQTATNNSTPPTTPSTAGKQLTNTGPGSDALIGFVIALIAGTLLHQLYLRKRRLN